VKPLASDTRVQRFKLEIRAESREAFYEGPFGPLHASFDDRGPRIQGEGLEARLDWSPLEPGEGRWKTENERLKEGFAATINGRGYVVRRPGSGWGRGGSALVLEEDGIERVRVRKRRLATLSAERPGGEVVARCSSGSRGKVWPPAQPGDVALLILLVVNLDLHLGNTTAGAPILPLY